MDIPDYKEKYGEPKTLEDILNYCAFISGQGGLEHRTLHHFNWFVSSLIFGKTEYETTTKWLETQDPESFAYKAAKGSIEDALKIYEKYHHIYHGCQEERPLIGYAVAFMEYCETEYAEMTAD
jgi:hypothetical protein